MEVPPPRPGKGSALPLGSVAGWAPIPSLDAVVKRQIFPLPGLQCKLIGQACFGFITQYLMIVLSFSSLNSLHTGSHSANVWELPSYLRAALVPMICGRTILGKPLSWSLCIKIHNFNEYAQDNVWRDGISVKAFSCNIVAYRPVAKRWLCKQRPLLGDSRKQTRLHRN
jgi:hypothetical protein